MSETIAAVATPTGQGGIGIVRISGAAALPVARAVTGLELRPRHAHYARFRDAQGRQVDEGLALYFPDPASFTGEDVVELHGHGGVVVMQLLLQAVLEQGARLAQPGEFTQRAFLNGKLDLAQAEAVADLIASGSAAAARGALRSLQGEFSERIALADAAVRQLRVHVEAAVDFPDEELELLADGAVADQLRQVGQTLSELLADARHGVLLSDGVTVALVGPPNVGKSSLLNALAGHPHAIVTEIPGTTRDVIRVALDLDGLPAVIVDTAGLRDSGDIVEQEGVRRARQAALAADLILQVRDRTLEVDVEPLEADAPIVEVGNKVDLTDLAPGRCGPAAVRVSAVTGAGLPELTQAMLDGIGFSQPEATFTARRRHLEALAAAEAALQTALQLVADAQPAELVAEELRAVHGRLGEIVGETTTDDLLGEIFASFCIGK